MCHRRCCFVTKWSSHTTHITDEGSLFGAVNNNNRKRPVIERSIISGPALVRPRGDRSSSSVDGSFTALFTLCVGSC